MAVYSTMLDHMSDEQKITVTAKLAQEVLSAAIDGGLPLASSSAASSNSSAFASGGGSKKSATLEARKKASAVVKDALTIMASPGIRVGAGRGGAAAAGDVDDGSGKSRGWWRACVEFVPSTETVFFFSFFRSSPSIHWQSRYNMVLLVFRRM